MHQWMLSLATVPTTHTMYRPALQGLEQWQQPLAKIAIDQTVLSLAWNSMYFGMLGAMRLDPPGQVRTPARCSPMMMLSGCEHLTVGSPGKHIWRSSSAVLAMSCLSFESQRVPA